MNNHLLNELRTAVQTQNLHVLHVIVRKDGEIIAAHDYAAEKPTLLWSVSKTFVAMGVGIAVSEGVLQLHDRIVDHFAGDIREPGEFLQRMTVHDLLVMGTGQAQCPVEQALAKQQPLDDIGKLFFAEPVVAEPGTRFVYNNAATYMLSKLISRTTGMNLSAYLEPRLFKPLGIPTPYWEADPNGITFGCSGLHLTARDLSKFGQLLLNQGIWNDTALIPADFIAQATQAQIDTSGFNAFFATADHKAGYGYQLWRNAYPNSYRMDGMYGQYVVMLPDHNAVVTYVSNEPVNMTGILELTWDTLVDKLGSV